MGFWTILCFVIYSSEPTTRHGKMSLKLFVVDAESIELQIVFRMDENDNEKGRKSKRLSGESESESTWQINGERGRWSAIMVSILCGSGQ